MLLGYDALGRLTLGQISVASTAASPTPQFSSFEGVSRRTKLSVALLAGFTSFVAPPPAQAAPVFVTFSQPTPYVYGHERRQEPWSFEATPAKQPTGGLFSSFEQRPEKPPRQSDAWHFEFTPTRVPFSGFFDFARHRSYRHTANNSGEIDFKLLPTADPQAGGTSRRLVNGRLVSPFKTAKQPKKPEIKLNPLPVPTQSPSPQPPRPIIRQLPVEVVTTPLPPMSIERRALEAIDQADVTAFLAKLDQDEQDAADIAEVMAMLEQDDLD